MTHFGELLKEARIRARLTQQELAKKVGINHSYISKIENEDFLPSFDIAMKLAEALGISDDEEKYLEFLSAAEDLKGFKLVKIAQGQTGRQRQKRQQVSPDEAEETEAEEEEQGSNAPIHSTANPSMKLPNVLLGARAQEIQRLIASFELEEEEERQVYAGLAEYTERLCSIVVTLRKPRKEV